MLTAGASYFDDFYENYEVGEKECYREGLEEEEEPEV